MRLLLSWLAALLLMAPGTGGAERPNILWFVADDMSANFSCYGEKLIQTPHVDRLAREGTLFKHAYTTAPVCSPSRSALITGMHQASIGAHQHRSGRGREKIRLPEGVTPLPVLFQKAGYFTCIGSGLPSGAGKQGALGKTDYNFEWEPGMYDGDDWAERKAGQPFFMQVQLPGGKLRGDSEESVKRLSKRAAERFGEAVKPAEVELPPHYPRDPVLLRDWAAYLDSVRLTDEHVGRVLARLEAEGILENTLVIFITDHGISHARGKQFLYDEGTHIPLLARGPGVPRGQTREDLVEHIDLAAVSLAAAGIPIPAGMQAKNVLAANYRPREAVFAGRDRCDETVERIRSARTAEWLYIRNYHPQRPHLQPNAYKDNKAILRRLRALQAEGKLAALSEKVLFSPTRPAEELYAWREDRWQLRNLAGEAAHGETLKKMRARLDAWIKESRDAGAESEAMYDSDMAVYLKSPNAEVEKNIQLMKQWAREGK